LCFILSPCRGDDKEDNWGNQVSSVWECEEKSHLEGSRYSAEAEEYPLLVAVTREQRLRTTQAGKDLACAVVIFKMWGLAMSL
jgi:hypothetical protein